MPNLLHLAWNTDGTRILPTIHSSICLKAPMVPCKYNSLKSHKSVLYLNQRSLERMTVIFLKLRCHNVIRKNHTEPEYDVPKEKEK